MDGGAATAERVEHHVAGVGGGVEDAFEKGDGFLGGVAEAFLGPEGPKCKDPAEAGPRDADKI